jgi:hypothetical protein
MLDLTFMILDRTGSENLQLKMLSVSTGTARRDVQIPWLSMKNWQQICGIEAQDWWV